MTDPANPGAGKAIGNGDGGGALRALGRRFLQGMASNPALFYYARTHAYWGAMARLRRGLDLQPGERLLEVGCGSGMGAALTRGTYVGVDTDLPYLRFARARLRRSSTHTFIRMSACDLGFRDAAFDKAVMLNVVHHLDDASLDRFFTQLKRVVRKRVFVLDFDPERDNAVSAWLRSHDRGAHVRRCGDLGRLLERHFRIERLDRFPNTLRSIFYVLYALEPPPDRRV